MALNRVVEMTVGLGAEGVLISDLDVDFRVDRSITVGEQTGLFTVYNAKEETRREVLKEGQGVVFKAGYEDEGIGTLFVGSVTQARSVKVGGDWRTTIEATSLRGENVSLDRVNVSLSYAPNTKLSEVARTLAGALGLAVFGESLADFRLPNGYTFAGLSSRALKYVSEILDGRGLGLYIDNAELIIYERGVQQSGRFASILLRYDSGLLTAEDITEAEDPRKRIRFESILIAKLQPNGLITVKSDRLNGTFIVEKLRFEGDNYGGDFRASGEAAE